MTRSYITKSAWSLGLIVLLLWLTSNGCKGKIADNPNPPSQIGVSSRQIANGDVALNYISDNTILIQNTGSADLLVGQIAQANPLDSPFSIVNNNCSGKSVPQSEKCSLTVRFIPTSQGIFTDSFDIPSNDSNEKSVIVAVAGSGIPGQSPSPLAQINVSSRQIAIGNVVLKNSSDQTFSIQSTGSANLNIGQIAQANTLGLPFSIVSDGCSGHSVQPSETCNVKVQFSPTSQGTFTDSFDIPSDAFNENPVTVDVTGSGKALRVAVNEVKTDSCSTGILELIINVTDQNNTPLSGLVLGDFQLKEEGVPQTINSVDPILVPVPISVAIVLDNSVSVQSQMQTIEDASNLFIGWLTMNDEASIIKFGEKPQQMCDFTNVTSDLMTAITTTPTQIGRPETRLYDALWFTVDKTAVRLKHKALVLISDGMDQNWNGEPNASVKTLDEVIANASANQVSIYPVGIGIVNSGVLNRLANETGGQYYYITNVDQLPDVYQAISNILLGRYSLKYVSALTGSSPIMVEIDVAGGTDEGVGALQIVGCP